MATNCVGCVKNLNSPSNVESKSSFEKIGHSRCYKSSPTKSEALYQFKRHPKGLYGSTTSLVHHSRHTKATNKECNIIPFQNRFRKINKQISLQKSVIHPRIVACAASLDDNRGADDDSEDRFIITIRKGDALHHLAKSFECSISDWLDANKDTISDPFLIYEDQELVVPPIAAKTGKIPPEYVDRVRIIPKRWPEPTPEPWIFPKYQLSEASNIAKAKASIYIGGLQRKKDEITATVLSSPIIRTLGWGSNGEPGAPGNGSTLRAGLVLALGFALLLAALVGIWRKEQQIVNDRLSYSSPPSPPPPPPSQYPPPYQSSESISASATVVVTETLPGPETFPTPASPEVSVVEDLDKIDEQPQVLYDETEKVPTPEPKDIPVLEPVEEIEEDDFSDESNGSITPKPLDEIFLVEEPDIGDATLGELENVTAIEEDIVEDLLIQDEDPTILQPIITVTEVSQEPLSSNEVLALELQILEDRKRKDFEELKIVLRTALPILSFGTGAFAIVSGGVQSSLEVIGLFVITNFIITELLWAADRNLLFEEITSITSHKKFIDFLKRKHIIS